MQILLLALFGFISLHLGVNTDDTIVVYSSSNNQQNLQQIINSISNNATILIKPGIYTESLIIENKIVNLIAAESNQVVEFQQLANDIILLYRNGGGGQVKGIAFTGINGTGISGSRNSQEGPPGKIDIFNCTFQDIGNGIINRFSLISIGNLIVNRAQWFSIDLQGLLGAPGTTVHDIFILDSGNGFIIRDINCAALIFWNIVCRNNEKCGLIIFDTLSGPLTIAESTFSVIVRDSLITDAQPTSGSKIYGDGFVAMKNKETIELRSSTVYNNFRSGASAWGSTLKLTNNQFRGNAFDLNYETMDGIAGSFQDSSRNICYDDFHGKNACHAVSSSVESPPALPPLGSP
ncbi:unnamed protein product [Rotaria sp. Silwood2]|nr:unnamed protein product [Rotaria sp. Silwood2]CAF3328192.1 unnamed protein product [Rotaria sp. Silwood2]CAF3403054.1 unnamed protein product [Rotaria sp. Silwood2]CAF4359390.1 unnamed protein product [Rotaria sp. Silwood2]CAF4470450.1 unnamed protein product [Rotaria sp. Silwood2]